MIELHRHSDGSPVYFQNIVGVVPGTLNGTADTPVSIVFVGKVAEETEYIVSESPREVLRKMGCLMQWRRDTEDAAKLADEALVKAADIARLRGQPEIQNEILALRNHYK